jgi:hypothetical protein
VCFFGAGLAKELGFWKAFNLSLCERECEF